MKIKNFIGNLPEIVIGLLVIATSIVVFIEIIFRYFLNFSLGWSDELAKNLFVWMSFLGAAVCIKRGLHFSFPLFIHKIPKKAAQALEIFNDTLIMGFCLVLLVTGIQSFQQSFKQTFIALNISYAWLYSVIPISSILMLIYLAQKIVRTVRGSDEAQIQSGG